MARTLKWILLIVFFSSPRLTEAQVPTSREDQTVQAAEAVLNEIMAIPAARIPQWMLADAKGVAIIPNVLKGGFVVGVRHGRGVMLVRDDKGGWQPPQFVSITGGSVGWQAGVQATDVVLVFKTDKSVRGLFSGKFTLGVDAAAAAGPVGRQAAAATDATLKAEIFSYSRSRGLFAGVSLDGSALQVDLDANQVYYRTLPTVPGTAATPQIPASAVKLMGTLAQHTAEPKPASAEPGLVPVTSSPQTPSASNPEALKQQTVEASRQLSLILDDSWRRHLALPAEFYSPMAQPSLESLTATIGRFDRIVPDARYRALAERPEFRSTHELLKRYQQAISPQPAPGAPNLPPPPIE